MKMKETIDNWRFGLFVGKHVHSVVVWHLSRFFFFSFFALSILAIALDGREEACGRECLIQSMIE